MVCSARPGYRLSRGYSGLGQAGFPAQSVAYPVSGEPEPYPQCPTPAPWMPYGA